MLSNKHTETELYTHTREIKVAIITKSLLFFYDKTTYSSFHNSFMDVYIHV